MAFTRLWKLLLPALAALALLASEGLAEQKPLPDQLKDEGLLIFDMARHPDPWTSCTFIAIQHAKISGKRYRDIGWTNGIRIVVLPPGEYTLDMLYGDSIHRDSAFFGGVTVNIRPSAQWKINRKFIIEPGKVTNLGAFPLMEDSTGGKRFRLFYVDNNKTLPALKAINPKLAATLTTDKFMLAPADYISPAQLNAIRTELLDSNTPA